MQITIRHAEPADAPALRDLYAMPNAQAGTLHLPTPPLSQWQKRLESNDVVALVAEVEGLLVGQISLLVEPNPRRKHVAGIGMGVRDDWAGKGVGSALMAAALDLADNWLNLHRIELTVYPDNEAAQALYRKFGFVEEGRARDFAFRQGRWSGIRISPSRRWRAAPASPSTIFTGCSRPWQGRRPGRCVGGCACSERPGSFATQTPASRLLRWGRALPAHRRLPRRFAAITVAPLASFVATSARMDTWRARMDTHGRARPLMLKVIHQQGAIP